MECPRAVVGKGVVSDKPVCRRHAAGERRSKANRDKWQKEWDDNRERDRLLEEEKKVRCPECKRPWEQS